MLQDTSTADGAFSHAFKAYQLPIFGNDMFASDQNHEKKHHLPSSVASVFQVSCSLSLFTDQREQYVHTISNDKEGLP